MLVTSDSLWPKAFLGCCKISIKVSKTWNSSPFQWNWTFLSKLTSRLVLYSSSPFGHQWKKIVFQKSFAGFCSISMNLLIKLQNSNWNFVNHSNLVISYNLNFPNKNLMKIFRSSSCFVYWAIVRCICSWFVSLLVCRCNNDLRFTSFSRSTFYMLLAFIKHVFLVLNLYQIETHTYTSALHCVRVIMEQRRNVPFQCICGERLFLRFIFFSFES